MRTNVIVVDNFYNDPDALRKYILEQGFPVTGNYPGARTVDHRSEELKQTFEKIVGKKIKHWDLQYNGSFQYTTKEMKSWIHRDCTRWAGLVYMSPDAPVDGGTAFFRHKETKIEEITTETDPIAKKKVEEASNDMSQWELVDEVGNVYNRLVLFRGTRSHRSMTYWGDNKENGRLFQLFFFNVYEDDE